MENLDRLQTFVYVADERSFTQAAHRLHVTPSAVSKQIAELEGRLGITLFNRSTRGVSLTEAGETLFAHCAETFDKLDQALASAQGLQAEPQGTLKLHVTFGFAQWVLAPLLPKFMQRFPDLQVEVTTSTPAMSLVRAGADVVVSGKTMPDPGVGYRDLGPVPYVIGATPEYFRTHGRPKTPQELAAHNSLRHTIYAPKAWPFTGPGRKFAVRVTGNFVSSSSEVLRQVALQSAGIVRLPIYTVREDIESERLETIFDGLTRTIQHTRIYFPLGRDLPAKTKAFIEFLEAELLAENPRLLRARPH
ncbi:MAG: LysR family transcriptional regulator [Alphaproteobacteria bacterium]